MVHCIALYLLLLSSLLVQINGKWNPDKICDPAIFYDKNLISTARICEKKCLKYHTNILISVDFTYNKNGDMHCEYLRDGQMDHKVIIGGIDAVPGEFAHSAAIGWDNDGHYAFLCGGSLISSRFVLTAAHCAKAHDIPNPEPVIVRLGKANIKGASTFDAYHDIRIKEIHINPLYTSKRQYNDIALIELATDVEFSDDVRPACLWTSNSFCKNTKAVAIGWGLTDFSTRKEADTLQKVSLDLLKNKDCNITLNYKFSNKWEGYSDSQICAGDLKGNRDTCQGDSGSPLQVVSEINPCIHFVMGVTAKGNSYCGTGPGVYTRVSEYLDWIEGIVWKEEL